MADTTLICSIELSKTAGMTLSVKQSDDSLTQTVVINGTTIVVTIKNKAANKKTTITQTLESFEFKVQGESDTSTITQKADLVKIECKNFVVESETITVHSKKNTSFQADKKYSVTSTEDMEFTASGKLTAKSTKDMALTSSAKLDAKATADATIKGNNATLEGQMKTTVKGGTGLDLKAAQITGTADAKLEMAGPMTNIGKNMTTISGQMVKIEGTLVKIG